MEPLTPNDPLWDLLGRSRPVEPRANFTQNVLRAARQTPQERGWAPRLRAWLGQQVSAPNRFAWAGAAAAAIVLMTAVWMVQEPAPVPMTVVATPPAAADASALDIGLPPASDAQWADLEQFDSLLAVYDTSDLTDREINVLLY